MGGTVGELSFLARSLSDHVARELEARELGSGREQLEKDAETVRSADDELLHLLPEVERHFDDDPAVRHATGEIATALEGLRGSAGRRVSS